MKCYSVTFAARRDSVVITLSTPVLRIMVSPVVVLPIGLVITTIRRKRKSTPVMIPLPLLPSAIPLPHLHTR